MAWEREILDTGKQYSKFLAFKMAAHNNKTGSDKMQNYSGVTISSGAGFAFLAGIFAAFASVFAKIAFDSQYIKQWLCQKVGEQNIIRPLTDVNNDSVVAEHYFKCDNVRSFLVGISYLSA